ncbi:SARS [Acanthosepion pharaonis]|uniref:serine--tRNA ligase n=1 Tax=Acanthosepion pharaonis TaxID=158019 RepID=A0A812D1F3_ACAPH|nr:SARS [Sepia pharaonis]
MAKILFQKFPKELKGEMIGLTGKRIPSLSAILELTSEAVKRLRVKGSASAASTFTTGQGSSQKTARRATVTSSFHVDSNNLSSAGYSLTDAMDLSVRLAHLETLLGAFRAADYNLAGQFEAGSDLVLIKGIIGLDLIHRLITLKLVPCLRGWAFSVPSGLVPFGTVDSFLSGDKIPCEVAHLSFNTVMGDTPEVNSSHLCFVLENQPTYLDPLAEFFPDSAEGCGIDYKSPGKIYTLQNLDVEIEAKVEHLSHFVGVSFMSFAAYLTRMEINSQSLPLRYFTIGKSYRPALSDSVDSGLYEAVQTSKCEACCVCIDKTTADLEFKELVNILWNWYSALGLPIRLVLLPAAGLQLSEMKKIVIEAWAPSLQKYVQVGSVSSTGIYVGQRLMILHSRMNSPPQPVHLVHAELLDVSKLIAFLMEYGNISDDQSPVWPGRNPC